MERLRICDGTRPTGRELTVVDGRFPALVPRAVKAHESRSSALTLFPSRFPYQGSSLSGRHGYPRSRSSCACRRCRGRETTALRVHGEFLFPQYFVGLASLLRWVMRALAVLFLHLLATLARLAGPGGARAVVAESVLVKQQLLILNRSRTRSPNLCLTERLVAGVCTLLMRPSRVVRSAIVLRPSTLLRLRRALIRRKYRRLFSSTVPTKPGPKGPSQDVIAAVVDMKRRNPTWGCPRIAQQIALAFGIPMNKDVVRRILAVRYQPKPDAEGPSWLTVLGHAKDSLWSVDLFRCESAILSAHWVLVVMDQFTRRIVVFAAPAVPWMAWGFVECSTEPRAANPPPTYLSSDNDRLYQFH